jgi:hypothetical protein
MMACLVGQDSTVERPRAAPAILIAITLVATPANPDRAHHQLAETSVLQRLSQLDHGNIESVLLDYEQLATCRVASAHHRAGAAERQSHRLFDHDMLAVRRKRNHIGLVVSALGQDNDDIDGVGAHDFVHVGISRHPKLRADPLSPFEFDVTDCHKTRIGDLLVCQQFRVAPSDTAASNKSKIQHQSKSQTRSRPRVVARDANARKRKHKDGLGRSRLSVTNETPLLATTARTFRLHMTWFKDAN